MMLRALGRAAVRALVVLLVASSLAPFAWAFWASLQKGSSLLMGDVRLLPDTLTLENYAPLLTSGVSIKQFYVYVGNSLQVGLLVAGIVTVVASMGAYGLVRYRPKGGRAVSAALLLAYVFPVTLIALPIHQMMARFGLIDRKLGVALAHAALAAPFCTWLLRAFFEAVPPELEEAALVDGCTRPRAFASVVMPLAAPGVLTAAMYALVLSWGEYMLASILITSDANKTLPLGIAMYTTEQYIEWGQLLAGTSLTFLPLLVIFFPLARLFLRGFLEGAVKF